MNTGQVHADFGVILAGGRGHRLGEVRKHDLRLAKIALWQHLEIALAPQCARIAIALGDRTAFWNHTTIEAIADDPKGPQGPAAGLFAAARWSSHFKAEGILATASVDAPFLPTDFVARMTAHLRADSPCAVAAFRGQVYATHSVWKLPALRSALDGMNGSTKSPGLHKLALAAGAAICPFDDFDENPFSGINTLAELLAVSRRFVNCVETV